MLKSVYDNRQFNYLKLDNGLRVLLIQDPFCNKSACSITLNVGHFNDDDDCHGISHLLEHMLFLGNEQFPTPNAFSEFVTMHGGSVNALTGTEYTSYFFDISVGYEKQGLMHLNAMLRQPLFDLSFIESELNAIEAEFLLKKKDDLRRLYQVHKETCNPAHPFSKFSVGNKETFSPFNAEELQFKISRLHKQYYQPENACLCFVSQQPLLTSEKSIREIFAGWTSTTSLPHLPLPDLYLAKDTGLQINILPLQKAKRMILTFALPAQQHLFRSKPLSVLSHILGDEGTGGLLQFYKTKNWATSLSAGGGIEGSTFKDFNINLQLTDTGIDQADQIITAFFSYIELLKKHKIEDWRIKETAMLNQLMWDYPEQAKAIDEASHFSQSMFEYPAKYLIAGDYIIDKPSSDSILQMLALFTPQNMRIKSVNAEVKTSKIAKWYETPYSSKPISNERLKSFVSGKWSDCFTLPKPNPFLHIPKQLNTVEQEYILPKQIINEDGLNIWFGQDDKFKQPKGDCFLTFDCEAVNEGLHITTAKRLWVALLNEKLNQKYYQANLAGMHFHFYPHQGGFSLQTNGFSTNQLTFFTELLTEIVVNNDFSTSFTQVKAKQYQGLSNALLNKPVNRLFSRLGVLIQQQNHSPMEMAEVMADLTPNDIATTKDKLLQQFHLEGLMYGDWSIKDAQRVSSDIKQFRHTHPVCKKIHRGVADIRQLNTQTHYVFCDHNDPAVVIYFQAPNASLHNIALTILAEQLIATPFFTQLRTEQQLGYLVGSGYIPYNQHPGIGFYVQSPHKSAEQLVLAIHHFLQQFVENLGDYAEVWEPLKRGVIKQLAEKDTNLSMKSQRLWMALGNQDTNFTYSQQMTESIMNIAFSELKTFLNLLVTRQGFGELILHSGAQKIHLEKSNFKVVTDIQSFKSHCQYL